MNIRAGLGAIKLYRYMKETKVKPELFQDFRAILQDEVNLSEVDYIVEHIETDTSYYKEKSISKQRMERIFQLCEANRIAFTIFELALLEYMDSSLDMLLGILFPGHRQGVRLLEAVKISYPMDEYFEHMKEIIQCDTILPLFLVKEPESLEPLFCHYRVDTWLAAFLSGVDDMPELLKNIADIFFPTDELDPLLFYKEVQEKMVCFLQRGVEQQADCAILRLYGEKNSGKRFFVRHCAKACKRNLVLVDFVRFMEGSKEEIKLKKEALMREVLLFQAMLGFYHVSEKEKESFSLFGLLIQEFSKKVDTIFLLSEELVRLEFIIKQPIYDSCLEKCSYQERIQIWKEWIKRYIPDFFHSISVLELENLANQVLLPIGAVKKVVQKMALTPEQYTKITDVLPLCNQFLDIEQENSLKKMETPYQMETIQLDNYTKSVLQDICNQIRNQTQVFDIWNMRQLYPYGRCISVLFTGPPGTGKTMAASVIANTVNMALYRVDLSQLMDKYIGETEKKLEHIFSQAEKSHGILFFDEADSIFGKRSELTDAKDRFANTQVAYLLQKIEEYDGVVILASNYRENIDKAFIRRIRFIVEFTYPDAKIRYRIWNSLFLESMEYEGIDFEFLADKFELSGAMIKNIVLKAAFLAASKQEPITMHEILTALIQEYHKLGKKIQKEELEEYAF